METQEPDHEHRWRIVDSSVGTGALRVVVGCKACDAKVTSRMTASHIAGVFADESERPSE